MVATGKITISGTIDVQGGRGGDRNYSSYTYQMYSGAGGGGGGGNVCLKGNGGFDLKGGIVDARGGVGGRAYYPTTSYNYPVYSQGGIGGRGAITLIAGVGREPTIVNAGNANLGTSGTIATGDFALTQNGVSKWIDSGATVPTYTGISSPGTAIATLYVEAAQSNPDTGLADPANTTGWKTSSELASLSGYRWFRFRVKLEGTTAAGKAPEVDRVIVTWTRKS